MLTGALASSYYGRPRTTMEVDVIVVAAPKDLANLSEVLAEAGLKAAQERLQLAYKSRYKIATIEDRTSPHTLDILLRSGRLQRKPAAS